MYDSGLGLKRIAKQLTSEQALAPMHFRCTNGLAPFAGWAPSTIRAVLTREIYRGVARWNKTRKKDDWGAAVTTLRPESEWQYVDVPHLRIIDEPLWRRVQARRTAMEGRTLRFADGRMSGRPPKHGTQNLLAGLATCALCGGGLIVDSSLRKSERIPQYVCQRARANGSCTNRLRISVAEMNEAVLQAVEEHALTPEAIELVIQLTERDDAQEHQAALARERKDVEKRIARFVAAVETAGDVASLAAKLRELEARRTAIDAELQHVLPLPRLAPKVVADRLDEWRRLLRKSTLQARGVLGRVIHGRIIFTPVQDGYTFEAPTRFDKLFSGIVFRGIIADRPDFVPTGGVPAHIGADVDRDYGRLLEAALNGWRARQDSNLWPSAPEADALSS
jgi:site-specific DNA recombinase